MYISSTGERGNGGTDRYREILSWRRISGERKCKIDFLNCDQKLMFKCSFAFIFNKNICGRTVLSRVTKNFQLTTEFLFFFVRKVYGVQICKLWVATPGILFQIKMQLSSCTSFLIELCNVLCGGLAWFRKEKIVV